MYNEKNLLFSYHRRIFCLKNLKILVLGSHRVAIYSVYIKLLYTLPYTYFKSRITADIVLFIVMFLLKIIYLILPLRVHDARPCTFYTVQFTFKIRINNLRCIRFSKTIFDRNYVLKLYYTQNSFYDLK